MKIYVCVVGELMTNCYIIENEETKEVLIVDPGDNASSIIESIEGREEKPVAILLTHAHSDHIMAVPELRKKYDLPVYIGEIETALLEDGARNNPFGSSEGMKADHTVKDGDELTLAGLTMKVIHTPGHTAGSVCYYFEKEKVLAAGDTLFYHSYGRTDLPTGSGKAMFFTLKKLLNELPGDVEVLPGHGRGTTIGYEKKVKKFI